MGKKPKSKKTNAGQTRSGAKASQRKEPPAQVQINLSVGDTVYLTGLKNISYHNKSGVIKSVAKTNGGRFGVLVEGEGKPVAILAKNLSAKPLTTAQQLADRNLAESHIERPKSETVSASQANIMNNMIETFMTEEDQMRMFGRKIEKVPNFVEEIMDTSLPVSVDPAWAAKYLNTSYESARLLPMFEVQFKSDLYKVEPFELLKRLGSNDHAKMKWYLENVTPGSIYELDVGNPYNGFIRHSFSNQAYRKEVLSHGTTHVAVGFVDLGILFAAELPDLDGKPADPLRFVGVESSAYAVAKSCVIWEMLKQTPEGPSPEQDHHLRAIMQAWFSAGWSDGTEEVVKASLTAIRSKDQKFDHVVKGILDYWADAPTFSLSDVRSIISDATPDSFSEIVQLLKKSDRIALGQYELSRDFGVDGKPMCGNTLMFDCPDSTPPLAKGETIFSALQWKSLMDKLTSKSMATKTIMDAAEEFVLEGVAKMASWARSGEVVVDLMCSSVEDAVDEIAALKPWTMSWSNVVDYIGYDEFHRIARRCSVNGDTIHFGYSMNWIQQVFGALLIDYPVDGRTALIDCANSAASKFYASLGWKKHLRLPVPTNPINSTGSIVLRHRYSSKWLDYFFAIGRRQGPCNVGNSELPVVSPLSSTGGVSVAFAWTYDPLIHFDVKRSTNGIPFFG